MDRIPADENRAERNGRWALALLLLLVGSVALGHLGGLRWDSDEGINLSKAWLLADGFRLYEEVWADQPPGYTVLLAAAFRILGPSLSAARGLTALLALAGLAGVALAARELLLARGAAPGRAWLGGLAAGLALALAPNYWWASRAAMIGLPAFAWASLSMGLALGYARHGRPRRLAAAALALGLSLWLKLQMIYLGLPLGLLVLWRHRAGLARWRLAPASRDLGLLALGSLGPLLASAAWYGPSRFGAQVLGTYLDTRAEYAVDLAGNLDTLWTWLRADNLGLALLAAAGALILLRRPTAPALLALSWTLLTVLTAMQHAPLWIKDHLEPLMFALASLAGLAVGELATAWRPRSAAAGGRGLGRPSPSGGAALGLLGLLAWLAWLPQVLAVDASLASARSYRNDGQIPSAADRETLQRRDDELRASAAWLAASSTPQDFVATDYQLVAFLAGRRVAPELAAFSSRAVGVGAFSDGLLVDAIERRRVPAVLLWDEEIASFEGLMTHLRSPGSGFRRDIDLGKDRSGWRRGPDPAAASASDPRFEGVARLLGHALDQGGGRLDLRLFWHTEGRSERQLSVFTHVYGPAGERHGQHDGPPDGGGQPTTDWPEGALVIDRHPIELDAGAPAGLRIHVGFYDPSSGRRVPARAGGQDIEGAAWILPEIIDPRGGAR